jgi:hypothetical protein
MNEKVLGLLGPCLDPLHSLAVHVARYKCIAYQNVMVTKLLEV